MVARMTEDLEPVTADGLQPEHDLSKTQHGSTPDPIAAAIAAADQKPPLLASSASAAPSEPVKKRPLWLAFLAAAVVALLSGLLWAGIVIATGYNLGILAVFIGAATGLTAQLVAGAGIGGFERGVAGIFAAGAIILGDYVIIVHELKDFLAAHSASVASVGYFSGDQINDFVHHFGTYVHGFDWFWIAIAAYAAFRTSGGGRVLGMGGTRS
jgi:hypothetical protein